MKTVNPEGCLPPRGYANGVLAEPGPVLYVAGQVGWEQDGTFASDDLVAQFARALDNVLLVVAAAGGSPSDIATMTIYVTDMVAYRAGQRGIGEAWRQRLGKHFPAMALVGVSELVEPRAKVEIQVIARLPQPVTASAPAAAPGKEQS